MSFYQNPIKYCNMAIYCNTLKHNTQYSIDPYCFAPNVNVRVWKSLKEELAWAIDKRLRVVSNKMLFKTVIPQRN